VSGDEDIGDEDIGDEDIGDEDIGDEDIGDEDIAWGSSPSNEPPALKLRSIEPS
jgi:hypothetical protein